MDYVGNQHGCYFWKAIPGPEQRLAEAALSVPATQVGETALAAEGASIPRRVAVDWTAAGDSEQRRAGVSLPEEWIDGLT